ncbi:PepSY domain-containing protein [Streptomyces sp. NPDC058280]|uniref:PepSY domain-containing protein n=1 Tax=Streptomyces sp. NPDC058280 TaxID=3346419 RepID=UPI0036E601DD
MKRNLVIAAITAAALIGGGTYTAVAMDDDDRSGTGTATAPVPVSRVTASDDATAGTTGTDDTADGVVATRTGLTASDAAAAALKKYPGAVASVERDDDGSDRTSRWEVELLGTDNRWHELKVDAVTGAVRTDGRHDDDDDRDDRAALRGAKVDARQAAAAALASVPGTVTSVDLDDDHKSRWEVDVRGKDGRTHELNVHAQTAKTTADRDDDHDGRDDRDDHDDDGQDD